MPSVAARLQSDLDALTNRIADLIRELPIERRNRYGSYVVIIAPDYYWGEASPQQSNDQLAIKRDYEEWSEIFKSVFTKAPDDLNRRLNKADRQFRNLDRIEF